MKGKYIPFNDGYGIVGFGYWCPKCHYTSEFTDCEKGCEKCNFNESYVDPDEWYDRKLSSISLIELGDTK